jgi:hypothetical protein
LVALSTAQRFAGGPDLEGEGWVPNITQKGLGDWSVNDIASFLETGDMPDGDSAGRLDAARDQEYIAVESGRSRSNGGISEVAAAGAGPDAAQKKKKASERGDDQQSPDRVAWTRNPNSVVNGGLRADSARSPEKRRNRNCRSPDHTVTEGPPNWVGFGTDTQFLSPHAVTNFRA